jgi:hypothetical protein
MIRSIRDALGRWMGSFLGLLIIAAFAALPVMGVLWVGAALGQRWAIGPQASIAIWLSDAFAAANDFLPAWMWFTVITLLWLSFLNVHVRGIVRDELVKHRDTHDERKAP